MFVPLWVCYCSFHLERHFLLFYLTHIYFTIQVGCHVPCDSLWGPSHCFSLLLRSSVAFCASLDTFNTAFVHPPLQDYRVRKVFEDAVSSYGEAWCLVCLFTPGPSCRLGTEAGAQYHVMNDWVKERMNGRGETGGQKLLHEVTRDNTQWN